jgi:putative hydrolase of the HAD superfamily
MVASFQQLATIDFHQIVTYARQDRIFDLFETGQVSAAQFRAALRQYLQHDITDQQIDTAWNSIMTGCPRPKLELIHGLQSHYRVLALSNINELHIAWLDENLRRLYQLPDMRSQFHHAYYSNEVGLRKPDRAIYDLVIQQQQLDPSTSLFIDDKLENIQGAIPTGLQTYHLVDRAKLFELFV